MKLKSIVLACFLVFAMSTLWAGMMPSAEEMKALDAKVDVLMEAYNKSDSTAFYAEWATAMASIATPQVFKMMFVDGAMKNYGAYISRKVIEAETVIVPNVPNGLLVYEAEFEKNAKMKLSINLMKEGDVWKFQQVTIQPLP